MQENDSLILKEEDRNWRKQKRDPWGYIYHHWTSRIIEDISVFLLFHSVLCSHNRTRQHLIKKAMCIKNLSVSQRNWLLCGFCSVPLVLGVFSLSLGVWLCVVVLHNSTLEQENQIYFEKVIPWMSQEEDGGVSNSMIHHLDNESPFSHTPVDNLGFYLLTLSFVTILGGSGRVITTSFFCVHLCHNRLTGQLFWAWLVLSSLAVTIEVLVTYDILQTLSHNDVAPPYNRDFFFRNDTHLGFYWLCHIFRYFIWIDLCLSGLALTLVCSVYKLQSRENQF